MAWEAAGGAEAEAKESIQNETLSCHFSAETGHLKVSWNGKQLIGGANCRVLLREGVRQSNDPGYSRKVEIKPVSDVFGQGRQLVADCRDAKGQVDAQFRATLYDRFDGLVLELRCRNVSSTPVIIRAIEPLRNGEEAGRMMREPGFTRVLTNGQMYYDAGKLKELRPGVHLNSWWNVALYSGERDPGLVIGYLENNSSQGRITVKQQLGEAGLISLLVESTYEEEFTLQPGAEVSSDRIIILFAKTAFAALEGYAGAVNKVHRVHLNPPVNGWCSWFSFFGAISEGEVLRQAKFAAQQLKPYGFEYVQVDDGFYRGFGDWEGNERFPHGMKWLAKEIRAAGLRPGIWLAPFVIAEDTKMAREHPEWLLRHADGRLQQIGPGLKEGSKEALEQKPKLYALDITHPGAAAWLRKLFDTVANDWGYDFIKIDFVEWSLLAAEKYHDPSWTKAAIYRRGFEIIREAIGPKRHLLDCGPGPVTVGLIDSMRIELDQPPVTWQQYFLHSASTAPAAAKRYYFHKRTWINDADHVVLSNLTLTQAQAAATIVGLSGGNMISGDRMTDLDPQRLEILRKVFPSFGEAARPIDLFESDRPEMFALTVKKDFGEWIVLGVFNADEKAPVEKTIQLERLGLKPEQAYVAFDFWKGKYFGAVRGELKLRLEPASVTLLAIHAQCGTPHVISTDRHFSQGGVELESVAWNASTRTLKGVSLGPPESSHSVFVYLPEKHPWVQADPFFFYDFPGYTLKVMEEQILRVQLRFAEKGRVDWQVDMKRFG